MFLTLFYEVSQLLVLELRDKYWDRAKSQGGLLGSVTSCFLHVTEPTIYMDEQEEGVSGVDISVFTEAFLKVTRLS